MDVEFIILSSHLHGDSHADFVHLICIEIMAIMEFRLLHGHFLGAKCVCMCGISRFDSDEIHF